VKYVAFGGEIGRWKGFDTRPRSGEILDQTETSPGSLVTQFGYYGRGKQEGFPVEGGNSVPTHPRFDTPRDREKIEGRPGEGKNSIR